LSAGFPLQSGLGGGFYKQLFFSPLIRSTTSIKNFASQKAFRYLFHDKKVSPKVKGCMIIWSDKKHMLKYIKHIPHSPQKNKNLSRHDRAFADADNSPNYTFILEVNV